MELLQVISENRVAVGQGRSRHLEIMSSNDLARRCELCPNLGMDSGRSEIEGKDRHRLKYSFHEGFTSQPSLR